MAPRNRGLARILRQEIPAYHCVSRCVRRALLSAAGANPGPVLAQGAGGHPPARASDESQLAAAGAGCNA